MKHPAFSFNAVTLLAHSGTTAEIALEGTLPDVRNSEVSLTDDGLVRFAGIATSLPSAVNVQGTIEAQWQGICSRCLDPVVRDIAIDVNEIFEPHPTEGETYALDSDMLDLTPLINEAIMLELPILVTCDEVCRGLCPQCGTNKNVQSCECTTVPRDLRWAALNDIVLPDDEQH